ncbi:MAG: hypothetical protein WD231_01115 [Candidatus Woykebacteria bacterium]
MKIKILSVEEFEIFDKLGTTERFELSSPFKSVTKPPSAITIGLRSAVSGTATYAEAKFYRIGDERDLKQGVLINVDTYRAWPHSRLIEGPIKDVDHHMYTYKNFEEFLDKLRLLEEQRQRKMLDNKL